MRRMRLVLAAGLTAGTVLVSACGGSGGPPEAEATVPAEAEATEPAEADVAEPALRDELLAMAEMDQAVRTGVAPEGDDRTADELFAEWDRVDREHGAGMREILDRHGWPGWSLVGRDGAHAAWLLIQHADLDLALQRDGLALMEAAVAAGDADPSDLAYLVDRVRVAEGRPQLYGTQWGLTDEGEWLPRTPIEDESEVDPRRESAGLGPLADYLRELEEMVANQPPG